MRLYNVPVWNGRGADYCSLATAPLFALAGWKRLDGLGALLRCSGVVFTLHHARPYLSHNKDIVRVIDLALAACCAVAVAVAYPTAQTALCYAAAAAVWRRVKMAPRKIKSLLHAWFHLVFLLALC